MNHPLPTIHLFKNGGLVQHQLALLVPPLPALLRAEELVDHLVVQSFGGYGGMGVWVCVVGGFVCGVRGLGVMMRTHVIAGC